MSDVRFYGYKHWTLEDIPRCFYVGKGVESRPFQIRNRNKKHNNVMKKHGRRVEVCIGPVTHEAAVKWEVEHVAIEKTYHFDDIEGIGCNFTKGGDGSFGWRASEEIRQKMSESAKRRGPTNKGFKFSKESRLKMRLAKLGKKRAPHSEETKRKIKASNLRNNYVPKNAQTVMKLSLDGVVLETYVSLAKAAKAMQNSFGKSVNVHARHIKNASKSQMIYLGYRFVYSATHKSVDV